jgi:uncharacterized membrane protein YqjE
MSEPSKEPPAGSAGVTGSLRSVIRHAAGLFQVRLSLALIELAEARDAFITVFVLAIAAIVAGSLTLIAVSAWIIVLLWEPLGGWIILILALIYAMLSVLLGRAAIRLIREGRLGLPQTMAELRQDRDALMTEDAR